MPENPWLPPPPHAASGGPAPAGNMSTVFTRPVQGVAILFDGHNGQDLQSLCEQWAPPEYDGQPAFGGVELVLDQPHAQLFDARERVWRLAPAGAWVILDGTGVLVLDDAWFHALFGAEAEVRPGEAEALVRAAGEVTRGIGALRGIVEQLDSRVLALRPQPPGEDLYARGSWGPCAAEAPPWSAERLQEVPRPGMRAPDPMPYERASSAA